MGHPQIFPIILTLFWVWEAKLPPYIHCAKTVKAMRLKHCHFSLKLSDNTFRKFLVSRTPGTQVTIN